MKLRLLWLACAAAGAHADTTLGTVTDRQWQPMRGTSNVGTPVATAAECWAVLTADAEARAATTATARCRRDLTRRITYSAPPPPPPAPPPPPPPPPPAACATSCTLFGSQVPAVASVNEAQSVNLGLRFTTDVAGWVTAVRFYKGSGNAAPHDVRLWSAAGLQLAAATSILETATGWQQVSIAPVAVLPGQEYTVSYRAAVGRYSYTAPFAWPAVAAPLRGTAGVFAYSAGAVQPTLTWNAANYFVEPVFTTSNPGTVTPPPPNLGTATLIWDASPDPRTVAYRVYYGTAPRTYNQAFGAGVLVPGTAVPEYIVRDLPPGTWYFAVTAVGEGIESGYSNEGSKVVAP